MAIGEKNVKFGWVWLGLFVTLGGYLLSRVMDPGWTGMQREIWKAAHVHGNVLGLLNILYGLTIDKAHLSDLLKQTGSWLAIVGTILFTGALFIMPFYLAVGMAEMVGAGAIILSLAIMAYGQLTS